MSSSTTTSAVGSGNLAGLEQLLHVTQILANGLRLGSRPNTVASHAPGSAGWRRVLEVHGDLRAPAVAYRRRSSPNRRSRRPSPGSDRQPMTLFSTSLMISASHSTRAPAGPLATQCDRPLPRSVTRLEIRHEPRQVLEAGARTRYTSSSGFSTRMASWTRTPALPPSAARVSCARPFARRGHSPVTPRYARGVAAAARHKPGTLRRLMPKAIAAVAVAIVAQRCAASPRLVASRSSLSALDVSTCITFLTPSSSSMGL